MRKALLVLASMILALNAGPSFGLQAAVSVVPQKHFLEELAGDLVQITVVIPPGASPVTYEPKPSQMAELRNCSLWFTVGVPFEKAQKDRMLKALPGLKEIKTYENLKLSPEDPHIWLSPSYVMLQARTMAMALAELDPSNLDHYMKGYSNLVRKVADLDGFLKKTLLPAKGKSFMVFHPSWGYFAKDYGLTQIALEAQGKEPKPKELASIIDKAKSLGIDTVFVQPQFSKAASEVLAKSIGGKVAPLDPLAENWEENLKKAAETLAGASR